MFLLHSPKMASRRRFNEITREDETTEKEGTATEVPLESDDDDGESGAESFLTDDELAYQEGLDPAEDSDSEKDEEPGTSTAEQIGEPTASPEKASSSGEHKPSRSQSHSRTRSRSPLRERGVSTSRSRTRSRSPGQGCSVSRGWGRKRCPIRKWPKRCGPVTSWKTESDPDSCPSSIKFIPARPPGHQLNSNGTYTPLDLFKLFFSNDTAKTLCQNTNRQASKNNESKKYTWTDINVQEFFKYVGLTFFFALVKLNTIHDYWKRNTIFSVPFPANIMPRDRYRVISWNIHMSDPEKDAENDKKKGAPDYDRLFRLRPLMDTIKNACKAFYHPRQNLSVDEKVAATRTQVGLKRYMKGKQTKCGFKLFVLADSSNGYTFDFSVYTGKTLFSTGAGLAYDSVMALVKPAHLGSGFNLYVDNFYTSPKLFKDLLSLNIGACGSYRDNRNDCQGSISNDPRGSIRWIRDGPLLFVKWMDTREVTICSTIHSAYSGCTVNRRVKTPEGQWAVKSIPCPTPVVDYNKYMEGFDLSDQVIHYYSVHHKSMRWYGTLFYHFLDIAATNSYLLHKEICREKQEEPMTHRAFLEELTAQLCGVSVVIPPAKAQSSHLPVAICTQQDISRRASYGRKTCIHCRQTRKVGQSTPWKCKQCDVALCLIADRNCFEAWHS
ncbi:piggyBac transposable element-derived protein 4-like [Sparus aurata]|nr:piggyBac transposable element-derived protein 4-like [Sparus aurata]